jgi:hypothetical protein
VDIKKTTEEIKSKYSKIEDYYSFDIYYKQGGYTINNIHVEPYIAISHQSGLIELTGKTIGSIHKKIDSWW